MGLGSSLNLLVESAGGFGKEQEEVLEVGAVELFVLRSVMEQFGEEGRGVEYFLIDYAFDFMDIIRVVGTEFPAPEAGPILLGLEVVEAGLLLGGGQDVEV